MNLAEICVGCIKNSKKFKTLEGLLLLYSKLDFGNPSLQELRVHVISNLSDRYPMLREKYGFEEMKLIFAQEDLDLFEKYHKDRMEIKNRFANLKGTIIEPTAKDIKPTEDGCYPIEVLVQGAAWPREVDPTKRETYLSESDFQTVFNMTKAEYRVKDRNMQMRLKKEHKLF